MKKVAFVASVGIHIKSFHLPYLEYFKNEGYKTYALTKDGCKYPNCDESIKIPFERSPFSKSTFKAYKELKKVIDKENFDIIHCHTPVAAFLTRLAARKARKNGTRVIYTAHGFHFSKEAPLLNWLIYFPIEWFASFFTDCIITLNKEDYNRAKKHLKAKSIYHVHGVGVDTDRFSDVVESKSEILKELNLPENTKILFSVGELNKNKNHQVILKAMAKINDDNLYYLIAGNGVQEKKLCELSKELGIEKKVKLLGYRTDINRLLNAVDIFCFPSHREGLPVSVMEAMASGLPVIASNIRGNTDLIDSGEGGFLCSPKSPSQFRESVKILLEDESLKEKFGQYNKEKIKIFSLKNVKEEMIKIYTIYM